MHNLILIQNSFTWKYNVNCQKVELSISYPLKQSKTCNRQVVLSEEAFSNNILSNCISNCPFVWGILAFKEVINVQHLERCPGLSVWVCLGCYNRMSKTG